MDFGPALVGEDRRFVGHFIQHGSSAAINHDLASKRHARANEHNSGFPVISGWEDWEIPRISITKFRLEGLLLA